MSMESTEQDVEKIGTYFSEMSHVFLEEYKNKGLKKHTKIILDFFKDKDLSDDVVVELGCGVGGLLYKFLELGAKNSYGIDLSESMIENAKELAKALNFEEKTNFFIGDFNSLSKGVLPINQADVVVADRVLCCSPVPLEILQSMINFKPKYLIVVQPRKNILSKLYMALRIWLRHLRYKIKHHDQETPYMPVKEYDKLCEDNNYKRVLQKFRYGWEIVIYQKNK